MYAHQRISPWPPGGRPCPELAAATSHRRAMLRDNNIWRDLLHDNIITKSSIIKWKLGDSHFGQTWWFEARFFYTFTLTSTTLKLKFWANKWRGAPGPFHIFWNKHDSIVDLLSSSEDWTQGMWRETWYIWQGEKNMWLLKETENM